MTAGPQKSPSRIGAQPTCLGHSLMLTRAAAEFFCAGYFRQPPCISHKKENIYAY